PRISFRGLRPGTRVKMRYAEMVYPDLPEYKGQAGMVMMENQRSAMEQDEYVAKGGDEVFAPRGTYHGYRYVEITGVDSPVAVDQVQGVVLTSATPFATKYECSSEPVNQLFHNTCWSTLANVFSVPTDCPQRNERMGWSGDLSVFSPTMSYLIQGAPFFRKHLRALRDTQLPDGAFTSIAPIGGGFGGPLWSSVGIVLPWQSWIQYGDKRALGEHYPAMKRYADCMLNNYIDKSEGYFKGTDSWGDLGDWLGFEVNKNDNTLLFDAYCVYQLQIMEKVAKILGKTNESLQWADLWRQRAQFIVSHYIDGRTGKTVGPGLGQQSKSRTKASGESIDTETSYALLLTFGILPDSLRDKVAGNLSDCVMNSRQGDNGHVYPPYSLMTGFIGTAWIADALSMAGRSDLAYKMLLNENFPSWLYPVKQGATTVWERLNSYTLQDGFGGNNSMNSFNHYAFGSVTSWLIQHSAGICRDDSVEAFRRFIVSPEPDMTGGISWARAEYDSQQGKIVSGWKREGSKVTYHVVIPANATAILRLHGNNLRRVVCNGRKLKMEKWRDGVYQKELGSGQYTIVAEMPEP
ncbi:MAG: family 78 glycoside hydrolase catalytic domain, partial [Prevotella sp.]